MQIFAVGLFPELLGDGGIQEAGRHTAAALDLIARRSHGRACFLSLNDSKGMHSINTDGSEITFRGFARDKFRFAVAAVRAVRRASARPSSLPPSCWRLIRISRYLRPSLDSFRPAASWWCNRTASRCGGRFRFFVGMR